MARVLALISWVAHTVAQVVQTLACTQDVAYLLDYGGSRGIGEGGGNENIVAKLAQLDNTLG